MYATEHVKHNTVLITGGTSGLGLELVKLFLNKRWVVVATGRQQITLPGYEENYTFVRIDFNDLEQVAFSIKKICETYDFDIVINNAGILSPPDYLTSKNDLEYTFQVNFISHLLVNEIVIQSIDNKPLIIAAVISPVYRLADIDPGRIINCSDYKPVKAYSNSKFSLALMCSYLSEKYKNRNVRCFSFDPGTFSSAIYRMQKPWFRLLYHIASPFMRKPGKIARVLGEVLLSGEIKRGMIYDKKKRVKQIPATEKLKTETFWKNCYNTIKYYI